MAQINSWGIKKFILIVLAIQIAMLGLVGLAILGFDIPVLRQIVGFIFLAFVPGLLLLRILKLHTLGSIETLLYSVGLSIAFVMFTGFFINMIYPLIGISRPISTLPVMATITFVVLILCAIAYKRGSSEKESLPQNNPIRWSELLSPPVLFLLLLPILSALGAHLVYLHYGNTMLVILLSLIALTVALVSLGKFIPQKLYPLAIITIGIALVWHWSLISPNLWGSDVFHEYQFQSLVLSNYIWDYTIIVNVNAMLSIVMLAPIYSLVLDLNTVWVFKIVYPLFFSLVPLALFQVYRKQTNDKIAFFAAFFFMSFPAFFSELALLSRQQIAELFLALSILLFMDKEMASTKRAALLILFALCIVVSHYGLSYVYMLYLLMASALLLLWRSSAVRGLWDNIVAKFSKLKDSVPITHQPPKLRDNRGSQSTLTITYVMLFIVFCFGWYMYVSDGSAFGTAVRIGNHVHDTLITDFFVVEAREGHVLQALGLEAMRVHDVEWRIAMIFQQITQVLIVVGFLGLIANWRKTRFHREYAIFALGSMVIIAMCIILPHFSANLNMTRLYHITLFFLAPFCILGGMAVSRYLFGILPRQRLRKKVASVHLNVMVMLVLLPYFLFGSGVIFEFSGATPSSMPLALYEADWTFITGPEIYASEWIKGVASPGSTIYGADGHAWRILWRGGPREWPSGVGLSVFNPDRQMGIDSYIFLRRWNVKHNEILVFARQGEAPIYEDLQTGAISSILDDRPKIYSNGWAEIRGWTSIEKGDI